MSAYRKKPVVIEAIQMPMESDQPGVRMVAEWMVNSGYVTASDRSGEFPPLDIDPMYLHGNRTLPDYGGNFLHIETLEGTMTASPGDFIIRGVQGEFYPCKPDIFAETYEPVVS
jgi:hypothetical protein